MKWVDIVLLALIAGVFVYALIKRVNPYEAFTEGAAEAVPTILRVLPSLGAMLAAISLFRLSGAMDALSGLLAPVLNRIGIPTELVTLTVLRPFSGSASLALLRDTLTTYGADSFVGSAASTLVGSSETIFYTLAVYCGSVGIKKARYAFPVSIICGLFGCIMSILLVKLM